MRKQKGGLDHLHPKIKDIEIKYTYLAGNRKK